MEFVEKCGDVLDELAKCEGRQELTRYEEVWGQVLWLEKGFWPEVRDVGV